MYNYLYDDVARIDGLAEELKFISRSNALICTGLKMPVAPLIRRR